MLKNNKAPDECYKRIVLLNSCYTILTIEILYKLKSFSKNIIRNNQNGFTKEKFTTDHIEIERSRDRNLEGKYLTCICACYYNNW